MLYLSIVTKVNKRNENNRILFKNLNYENKKEIIPLKHSLLFLFRGDKKYNKRIMASTQYMYTSVAPYNNILYSNKMYIISFKKAFS